MSDIQNVMDYVMKTPYNTNPAILKQQLEGLSAGGSGNNQSLYGLPYKCRLAYAGEIEPEIDEEGNTKEIRIQPEVYLNDGIPFIVFCGDKINDNKYLTCMGRMIGEMYDDEGYDSVYYHFYSGDKGDVYPKLSASQNNHIILHEDYTIGGDLPVYEYSSNIESKHFLTIYALAPSDQEDVIEIQLEDYIDPKLLPIPTLFSVFNSDDGNVAAGCNRSYEQVMNDIKNYKLECYSNALNSSILLKAIGCFGNQIIFIYPSSDSLQLFYYFINENNAAIYGEGFDEGE